MTHWFTQTRLTTLALARAWRWRGFVLAAFVVTAWFSRQPGFPAGSLSWFPLGANGVNWLTCLLAAGTLILGVDCIGQWDRHRARAILESRLIRPTPFVASQWVAAVFLGILPAAIVTFWAPIGAWRAGFGPAWEPNLIYFFATALPAVSAGAAAGLAARMLLPSDTPAVVLGAFLLAPFLYFRLLAAPATEPFLLASESLGILLPTDLIVREALIAAAYPLLLLALGALLLPRPKGAGVIRPRGIGRLLHPGWVLGALRLLGLRLRQQSIPAVLFLAVVALGGIPVLQICLVHFQDRPRSMDWTAVREPSGINAGRIDTPHIHHRSIELPSEPTDPISISMKIRPREDQRHVSLTFGSHLQWVGGTMEGESIRLATDAVSPGFPALVLELPRLVQMEEEVELRMELEPRPSSLRLWERAWHPRFHRFSFLGPWYGEVIGINYPFQEWARTFQPSPFSISVPEREPLLWSLGSATMEPLEGGRVELVSPVPVRLDRLVAGDLVEVPLGERQGFPLKARVLHNHSRLVREFDVIFGEQFLRLGGLFPVIDPPLVLQEVPESTPDDPLALGSSTLDRLETLLPNFDHFEHPTREEFYDFFVAIHGGIVEEVMARSFSGFEEPDLLRDALAEYIHKIALRSGRTAGMRRAIRREIVLIPWPFVQRRVDPFEVAPGETDRWLGPLFSGERPNTMPPPAPRRPLAFHHMLRGLMGEDAYTEFLRELFSQEERPVLTISLFRRLAEKHHGEELSWFFNQWLREGVLPSLHIAEGQGFLFEDPSTRALVYRVQVTVENRGTGRVAAPWVLATEGDPIEGTVWLDGGESKVIELPTLARPVVFDLDPNGWIVQPRPEREEGRRPPRRPQLFFRTITEL